MGPPIVGRLLDGNFPEEDPLAILTHEGPSPKIGIHVYAGAVVVEVQLISSSSSSGSSSSSISSSSCLRLVRNWTSGDIVKAKGMAIVSSGLKHLRRHREMRILDSSKLTGNLAEHIQSIAEGRALLTDDDHEVTDQVKNDEVYVLTLA